MRFAKWVCLLAGVSGIVPVVPPYFLERLRLDGCDPVDLIVVADLGTPAAITKERGKRDDDPRRSPPVCGRVGGGVERP
jgi:hypothetical protein